MKSFYPGGLTVTLDVRAAPERVTGVGFSSLISLNPWSRQKERERERQTGRQTEGDRQLKGRKPLPVSRRWQAVWKAPLRNSRPMIANIRIANRTRRPICSSGAIALRIDLRTTCRPASTTHAVCLVSSTNQCWIRAFNFKYSNTSAVFEYQSM